MMKNKNKEKKTLERFSEMINNQFPRVNAANVTNEYKFLDIVQCRFLINFQRTQVHKKKT